MNFSRQEVKALFDGRRVLSQLPYPNFGEDKETQAAIAEGSGRLSISGAQEKYAMVVEGHQLRLTKKGEAGRFIVKPAPGDRRFWLRPDMPVNEYITMRIAQRIFGLEVAAHGLCFLGNGEPVYLTRRFDYLSDGSKIPMEDLASLAGLNRDNAGTDYKYNRLSYEDCANLIWRYSVAPKVDLLKFYRLILFNFLFCNSDAHLKNFSLFAPRPGEYRLAPAYDLLNTQLHLGSPIFALEKGLFKEGTPITDTTPIGRPLFEEFGRRLGFQEMLIQREIGRFAKEYPDVEALVLGSLLSPEAKSRYLKDYKYRQSTLQ
ncbi:MAG: HipA domain-containing protein [Bacteroidales bacterium]|nr:HipA domain-containing protein [Bacteroidales bacterium]